MLSDREIIKRFEEDKRRAERGLAYQRDQVRINQGYFAGNEVVKVDIPGRGRRRPMVYFNRVKPFISSVAGFMVQTRRKPDYQAVIEDSGEQQERSAYLNAVSDYIRKNAYAAQVETRQDLDMLIGGYGAIDTNVTYDGRNPDGEVAFELVDPMEVFWDPSARDTNLMDAHYVYRRKKMLLDDALLLYGGDEQDYDMQASDGGMREYNPDGGVYDSIERETGDPEEKAVVYCYQWWEYKRYYRLRNPIYDLPDPTLINVLALAMSNIKAIREQDEEYQYEDLFDFNPTAEYLIADETIYRDLKALFKRFDVAVEFSRHHRRCYYTAILSGKKVFTKYKNPNQDGFTIKFKTADYDAINKCWFGLVSVLREPAKYANKALTEMMFVIASNSKGGVMYEQNAVLDAQKFEQQWASTQAAIAVKDGSLQNGLIQPKAQAALPNGYENILAESKGALSESAGINPEFLGSSENKQVSAILERQRIKQVVTALATYFDAIALYQIENARLMITYIRILAENSEGRLIRLLTEEGAVQFIRLMQDHLADEYEVDIGEIPETAAEKEETANLLLALGQAVAVFGLNIYPAVVRALPIKEKTKRELLELMAPPAPQPPDPLQQAMAEAQLRNIQADTAYKEWGAVERQSNAVDNQADAALKAAKTRKEGMDTVKTAAELAVLAQPKLEPAFNQLYGGN